MRYSPLTGRVAGRGAEAWAIHIEARRQAEAGEDVIFLTVGDPDLDAIASAVTPRTRAIWINTPHNPTGAVMTSDEMQAVAALCRKHDLWLVSDEVYEDLAFARPHTGAWSLPDMAERTVVISSLSKSHALPAFRLGWVVGPPELATHLFNLLLSMTYGGPAFIQEGALAASEEGLPE